MIDFDRMVLLSGLALVVAVATFNNVQASAPQHARNPVPSAEAGVLFNKAEGPMAEPKPVLPARYWTAPETSPLQGVGAGLPAVAPLSYPYTR